MAASNGKASGKSPTKGEILTHTAEETGLSKKEVSAVLDALMGQIKSAVGKKGPGVFAMPGLMKIVVVNKPATKARTGINPFTKLEQVFKAKPARRMVKVRPLKSLKEMVS